VLKMLISIWVILCLQSTAQGVISEDRTWYTTSIDQDLLQSPLHSSRAESKVICVARATQITNADLACYDGMNCSVYTANMPGHTDHSSSSSNILHCMTSVAPTQGKFSVL
ncbi:hypothetical protein SK128_028026, partial [Halocaridina rubra]